LHREASALEVKIEGAKETAEHLTYKIKESQQPAFIERQARDQLDLVKEGDLVFVFADESQVATQY
jgi:cell division protein FtsB